MDNPGLHNLGDVAVAAINAATTATVVTSDTNSATNSSLTTVAYVGGLAGMLAATLQGNFNWGAGGTSIKATWETTLDQGTTWVEVCRMAFAGASEQNIVNLSGLTPKTTLYTPAVLSDDTSVDGILGDRWRVRILTVGTYTGNTSLSFRLIAR